MIDQNGFRMGASASCLLPIFRAADVMARETTNCVEWPDIDVVTDRNNLRKLLEFLGFAYREIELARGRRSRHSIVN